MSRNTVRALLLSSASVLTLAAFGAQAKTIRIPGGGASLPSQDYAGPLVVNNATPTKPSEEKLFNNANASQQFQYFYASSGRGQAAFSGNNPANFQYTGVTKLPTFVAYAASDAFLNAAGGAANGYTFASGLKDADGTVIPGVSPDYSFNPPLTGSRIKTDGALIQLPMLGVAVAIPAAPGNSAVTGNGKLHLTDADLCGVFSGAIKTFGGISNPLSGLTGNINVYYRADGSGTSFLFTNHLKAVCTAANSTAAFFAALQSTAPTTSFAKLFTGYTTDGKGDYFVPNGTFSNNNGGSIGSGALATAMAGTVTTSGGSTVGQASDPQSIGYLSTDFTDISTNGQANDIAAPNPPGGFINTAALFDSAVLSHNSAGTAAYLTPSLKNIGLSFKHAGAGSTHAKPPTGTKTRNPLNWVPSIPTVNQGYPIVGFTTWELAQCYKNANIASAVAAFLDARFDSTNPLRAMYLSVINANGFTLPSAGYDTAIVSTFLSGGALGIEQAGSSAKSGDCKAVTGR